MSTPHFQDATIFVSPQQMSGNKMDKPTGRENLPNHVLQQFAGRLQQMAEQEDKYRAHVQMKKSLATAHAVNSKTISNPITSDGAKLH